MESKTAVKLKNTNYDLAFFLVEIEDDLACHQEFPYMEMLPASFAYDLASSLAKMASVNESWRIKETTSGTTMFNIAVMMLAKQLQNITFHIIKEINNE